MTANRKSSILLLLAWAMGLLGWVLGVALTPDWFARLGSLVVLFAVMSEYILIHAALASLYKRLDAIQPDDDIPDLSPSKWYQKKVWLSHLTVVFGTAIWGFGDLVLKWVHL